MKDGTVGVSGNYKLTVNKLSKLDGYPIPNIDDLYTKLAGGQSFTELDFSHAYEQMLVDEDSRELFTINTHRLPYGVSSAPGIFQRTMEGLLQGIPSTGVLLDNILISGSSTEVHLDNIENVLERLSQARLRLKAAKCQFLKPATSYWDTVLMQKVSTPLKPKWGLSRRPLLRPTPMN